MIRIAAILANVEDKSATNVVISNSEGFGSTGTETKMSHLFLTTAVILIGLMVMMVYRIVQGPTVIDRIVAVNVIGTKSIVSFIEKFWQAKQRPCGLNFSPGRVSGCIHFIQYCIYSG